EGPSRQQVGAARGGAEIDLEDYYTEATESREGGATDECEPRAATCDDKGDDKRACQVESDRGLMVLVPQLSRPKPSMMHDHPDSWTFYAFASSGQFIILTLFMLMESCWQFEYGVSTTMDTTYQLEVLNVNEKSGVIIKQLAKDGEKERVLEHTRRSSRKSIESDINTPYHSIQILSITRLRLIQDHCLTLKNTPYPHQQIRRIRYFGQLLEQARLPSIRRQCINMTY
ncbi:hypothetical protein Tco_1348085, partial [Tanacetum coccineum]